MIQLFLLLIVAVAAVISAVFAMRYLDNKKDWAMRQSDEKK